MRIKVEETKDSAKDQHDKTQEHQDASVIMIYTDGSGIEKKIGAATYNPKMSEVNYQHLGDETQFNVYSAELTAICLALGQMLDVYGYNICRIYMDSQAAVEAINRPRRQSGQAIIKELLLDRIDEVASMGLRLEVIWIPGHSDIEGNERADVEAKKAATDTMLSKPFNHRPLKSARVRHIKTAAKTQWHKEWQETTKTATALRRITRRGGKVGPKFYNGIKSRNMAATITQLRTGHCGLNHYLHRFHISDTPHCECGAGKETVEHFLLQCPRYIKQREPLRKEVGMRNMRVDKLLGDLKLVKHTMEYIKSTNRLEV